MRRIIAHILIACFLQGAVSLAVPSEAQSHGGGHPGTGEHHGTGRHASAGTTAPSGRRMRSPGTSCAAGPLLHSPSRITNAVGARPLLERHERLVRATFLNEAERDVEQQQARNERCSEGSAARQLQHDGSFEHPRNRRPELREIDVPGSRHVLGHGHSTRIQRAAGEPRRLPDRSVAHSAWPDAAQCRCTVSPLAIAR